MLAQLLSFLFWTVELCLFLLLWIVCFYCIYVGLHRGLRKYLDSLATTVITGLVIVSLIFEIFYLYQVERAKAMEAYNKVVIFIVSCKFIIRSKVSGIWLPLEQR